MWVESRLIHHQEQDGESWADFYQAGPSLGAALMN
jgi:hypothetical protein